MNRSRRDDSAARFALVGCTNFVVSFTVFYVIFPLALGVKLP